MRFSLPDEGMRRSSSTSQISVLGQDTPLQVMDRKILYGVCEWVIVACSKK